MLSVPYYLKNKNKYCIAYYGSCREYILQLLYLLDPIEKELPGIDLYISCRKDMLYLGDFFSSLKDKMFSDEGNDEFRNIFSYVRLLKCDMKEHPVWQLLKESDLKLPTLIPPQPKSETNKCIICTKGVLPTKSLDQVNKFVAKANNEGYSVGIDENIKGAGWVMGVESESLFLAAMKGIRTTLIPTGLGTNLYKKLFPNNEIL